MIGVSGHPGVPAVQPAERACRNGSVAVTTRELNMEAASVWAVTRTGRAVLSGAVKVPYQISRLFEVVLCMYGGTLELRLCTVEVKSVLNL